MRSVINNHRQLRFVLPRTWDSLKAWHGLLSWTPRLPITLELSEFIFLTAINMAMELRGPRGFLYATAGCLLRFAFHGLLRPAEFLQAEVRDFYDLVHPSGKRLGILALRNPKTKDWFGRSQFATVRDEAATAWLAWALHGRARPKKIWPRSAHALRVTFKNILARAGLGHIPFNLSSFRPGGATNLFILGWHVEAIQFAGRWRSILTLKSYIQEAMSHLVWNRLDEHTAEFVKAQRLAYAVVLDQPPRVPAAVCFGHGGLP